MHLQRKGEVEDIEHNISLYTESSLQRLLLVCDDTLGPNVWKPHFRPYYQCNLHLNLLLGRLGNTQGDSLKFGEWVPRTQVQSFERNAEQFYHGNVHSMCCHFSINLISAIRVRWSPVGCSRPYFVQRLLPWSSAILSPTTEDAG